MATTKKDLLKEATQLGIEVPSKVTITALKKMIAENQEKKSPEPEKAEEKNEPVLAKAGKRSAKAIAEAEAKEEKELKKTQKSTEPTPKPKVLQNRPRAERRGKHYRESLKQIEKGQLYNIEQAVALAKSTSTVKFDATVELHVNLNVDPRHADQNIRDNVVLPAGSGKTVRVAVVSDDGPAAKAAGADIFDTDDVLASLEKGAIGFDTLIATPAKMASLAKYARILGPRGLMPNPKSGTVTNDIDKAVKEAKAGRVEYRVDSTGIVHLGLGKVSFKEQQLAENVQAVLASIRSNKPQSVKSNYIKAIHLSTSMGPSIPLEVTTTT